MFELLRAPGSVQMECRSTWRSRDCLPKDGTRRWVKKLLEQGPSGQAASVICSGGVSAVMAPPISIHKVWLRRVDSASVQSRIAIRNKTDEIGSGVLVAHA